MKLRNMFRPNRPHERCVAMFELTEGVATIVKSFPFECRVDGTLVNTETEAGGSPRAFYFEERSGRVFLKRGSIAPDLQCFLFGSDWEEEVQLQAGVEYLLQMNNRLFVFRYNTDHPDWIERINSTCWFLFDYRDDSKGQEFSFDALIEHLTKENLDSNHMGVSVEGLEGSFSLKQIMAMPQMRGKPDLPLELSLDLSPEWDIEETPVENHSNVVNPGPLLSPFCWERFDYGDVLHISVDHRLKGDPVLGKDELLRFSATRFDRHGRALDAYGNPCVEIADPFTRYRLPQGFIELPQFVFSIVGAPGSGKSNYLSVLINTLQHTLFERFGMVLKDADPARNAPLNAMKNSLFGGGSVEQAALLKTQFDGSMYLKIKMGDQILSLPRPFVYTLFNTRTEKGLCNMVFYDNAGEHFEPGFETSHGPGAQHVACSDALFFLVDPVSLPGFRKRLQAHPDPQLKQAGRIDQQDVLLSELEIRIRKVSQEKAGGKLKRPLAVILGKCDIWMSLLGQSQFLPPISGEMVVQDALQHNSSLVRHLLLELAPSIVANAESISNQVMYFPVSAFGHSPTRLPGGELAPNPDRIKPFQIEVPTLWALWQKLPSAFKLRPLPPLPRESGRTVNEESS